MVLQTLKRTLARLICAALLLSSWGPEAAAAARVAAVNPGLGSAGLSASAAGAFNPQAPKLALPNQGLVLPTLTQAFPQVQINPSATVNPAAVSQEASAQVSASAVMKAGPVAAAPVSPKASPRFSAAEQKAGAKQAGQQTAQASASASSHREVLGKAVEKAAKPGISALEAKADMDAAFEGMPGREKASAVPVFGKGRLRRNLLTAGIAAATVVSGGVLAAGEPLAPVVAPAVDQGAGWLDQAMAFSAWPPILQVAFAALAPFALFVIPALVKAFYNRTSAVNRRLIDRAVKSPTRIETTETHRTYVLEVRRKIQGGGIFYDRFKVVAPLDAAPGSLRFRLLSKVVVETEAARLDAQGRRTGDIVRFHYTMKGKPAGSIGLRIRRVRGLDGKTTEKSVASYRENSSRESFWARWAPSESGKFSWLLLGSMAFLPAYVLASAPAHPWETFLAGGVGGLLGAGVGYLMKAYHEKKWVEHAVVWSLLPILGASLWLWGIPGMLSFTLVGFVSGIMARASTPTEKLKLPAGPAAESARRSGSLLSKLKYAVAGALAVFMLAMTLVPSPASADLRAQITSKIAASGPVGREYAAFMESHPDAHLYIIKPWHRGASKMDGAVGLHQDGVPLVTTPKISLNGQYYGIGTWGDLELALSTIVHEYDHDKQEEDLEGVATTTSHEHSAWDHQARFIIEQFVSNPRLFEADGTTADIRRLTVLDRAVEWLNGGPAAQRALVDRLYDNNPNLSDVRHPNAEAWKAYYAEHRAESEAAWRERIVDVDLVVKINEQYAKLLRAPSVQGEIPEMKPDGSTLGWAFFSGLAALLSLLGFERLAGRLKKN